MRNIPQNLLDKKKEAFCTRVVHDRGLSSLTVQVDDSVHISWDAGGSRSLIHAVYEEVHCAVILAQAANSITLLQHETSFNVNSCPTGKQCEHFEKVHSMKNVTF